VIVPPVAVQFTAVFAVPLTVAVNCCVALVSRLVVLGLSATAIVAGVGTGVGVGAGVGVGVGGGGGVVDTVIVATSDLVPSAWLVAFTVKVPAEPGAVYMPEEEMVPPVAVQFTAVLDNPLTVAENCCWLLTCTATLCGLTTTETGVAAGEGVGEGVGLLLAVLLFTPPQPPMARMNWSKNNINNTVKMECRLNKRCTLVEFSKLFIGGLLSNTYLVVLFSRSRQTSRSHNGTYLAKGVAHRCQKGPRKSQIRTCPAYLNAFP